MLTEGKLDEIRPVPSLQILFQIPSVALHWILGFHVSGFIEKNLKRIKLLFFLRKCQEYVYNNRHNFQYPL
jgi:hypothetical protein